MLLDIRSKVVSMFSHRLSTIIIVLRLLGISSPFRKVTVSQDTYMFAAIYRRKLRLFVPKSKPRNKRVKTTESQSITTPISASTAMSPYVISSFIDTATQDFNQAGTY